MRTCALDADGTLAIPDKSGFGVDLDPEKVGRYCKEASGLFSVG